MTAVDRALDKIAAYDHLAFELWLRGRPIITRLLARSYPPDRIYQLDDQGYVIIDGYVGERVGVQPVEGGPVQVVDPSRLTDRTDELQAVRATR